MFSLILRNFLALSSLLFLLAGFLNAGTDFTITPQVHYHSSNNLLDSGNWIDDRENYLAFAFAVTSESKNFLFDMLFEYIIGSVIHRTAPLIDERMKFTYPFYKKSTEPFMRINFNEVSYNFPLRDFSRIWVILPLIQPLKTTNQSF